ncbi:MAG: TIGR04283 family arsenosugar biosynthesis glycosyltransferase [Balneolaceae bacterium]|nr:TIGR04283 family arsenosugar biosynthesis glycosyltransferase [Balneolaceae bacterium]
MSRSDTIGISVIIPVFNEEENIGNLIDYLNRSNQGVMHEIIVVDGGSTDRTPQIVKEKGARLIRSVKKGRAVQMNEGAKAAGEDLLYFLHADSLPPEGFDREILAAANNGFGAGCFRLAFDTNHPLLRFYAYFTRFRSTLLRFGDQSLFVSKKIFEQTGGFDETLTVMEDQEIVRELKKITRFYLSDREVITSARKYRKTGMIRLQGVFSLIWILYYLGVPQEGLVQIYKRYIKS